MRLKNKEPNLKVYIAGLTLQNPVMNASGTFGLEYERFTDIGKMGAIVAKTITLEPRAGNPQPRTSETIGGMINRIGLANPGVDVFVQEKLPLYLKFGIPLIVSIAGKTADQYARLAGILEKRIEVNAIEVNISCPNVEEKPFGEDVDLTKEVVASVRKATKLPLIVKLSPNVTDIALIARAAVKEGADALSLINTLKAMKKIHSGPDKGKWISGGLSGPCIMPVALHKVRQVIEADLDVPTIGIGGITSADDALEFLAIGATAVQIGTANFVNPNVIVEVVKGIRDFLVKEKIGDINDFIGRAFN